MAYAAKPLCLPGVAMRWGGNGLVVLVVLAVVGESESLLLF